MPLLPESTLSVPDRLSRLVVAIDAGCHRSELVADVEVAQSVLAIQGGDSGNLTTPS